LLSRPYSSAYADLPRHRWETGSRPGHEHRSACVVGRQSRVSTGHLYQVEQRCGWDPDELAEPKHGVGHLPQRMSSYAAVRPMPSTAAAVGTSTTGGNERTSASVMWSVAGIIVGPFPQRHGAQLQGSEDRAAFLSYGGETIAD
jgi:hypothetical protein